MNRPALLIYSGIVLLFLALPILLIVVVSFSSAGYLTFPPPGFGLRWYRAYRGQRRMAGGDQPEPVDRRGRRRAVHDPRHARRAWPCEPAAARRAVRRRR